ncbi:hypothetical protein [Rhizobium sp. NXC24]|uniref:hypothetical protein n=1 Tax=Rhizobium sp. NXC24 TaxID=2048897 RepID=UPI00131A54F1|nr:hypothetical protein [Rhizobium sp. NXC24]
MNRRDSWGQACLLIVITGQRLGAELLSDDVESAFDIIEGALPHDWLGVGIYVPYPTTPTGRRYLLNPCDNPEQMAVANLRLVLVGTFLNHEAIVPQSNCGTVTHFSLCSEYRLSIETLADHGNVSPALDRADQLKRQLKRMCRDRLAPLLFPRFGAVAWLRVQARKRFCSLWPRLHSASRSGRPSKSSWS